MIFESRSPLRPHRLAWRRIAQFLFTFVFVAVAVTVAQADDLAIQVLSNRADLISGGEALVEIILPGGVAAGDVHVTRNGIEVTSSFGLTVTGRFIGLVEGLNLGDNDIEAAINPPTPHQSAHIVVVDHPIGGPVFAGAQLQPWVCARKVATSVSVTVPGTGTANVTTRASGLADDPIDAQCNTPPTLAYFYQPKALEGSTCNFTNAGAGACFIAYNPASPPADVDIANFTNDHGDVVKSIIVLEKGTINRTVYQLVTFYDPTQPSTPQARQHGWNRKLLWNFGASSGTSRFESPPGTGVFNTTALSRGFMIASASLTDHGTNANDQLAAETMAMLKEQITETYGEIRYTMGAGCSGGSILQYNIAAAYPGLLQGIQPNCTFPDTLTTAIEVSDCGLLQANYYTTTPGSTLTTAQRAAINGHLNTNFCNAWNLAFLPTGNPATPGNCGSGWPAALTYSPISRPNGVRCEVFDHDVAMLGTFVDTDGNTKANIPYDNVGVQYGLKALAAGTINAEQFVQVNEGVGSYTADQVYVKPQRAVASLSTLHTVYSGSLVSDGRQLAKVAIIDLRGQQLAADIHMNWRSWQVRDRLDRANGNHDNQVIWATSTAGNTPGAAMLLRSFNTMDTWLANIEVDASNTPLPQKIINNKPPLAHDLCTNSNGANEAQIVDVGLGTPACLLTYQASPHQAAGGPLAEDIFKCTLKPLDFASPDYNGVAFSVVQQGRLATVFPGGVCDWTQPGVGQVPADSWTTFENGPGGEPLGDPPLSDLVPPLCGDGEVTAEDCDDGNTSAGDGCAATCTIEPGYACGGSPSTCTPICGDGLVVGGEGCDDGNTSAGDGCAAACTVESGYTCGGAPSACTAICGDGVILGAETCDDANTAAGDGCASTCTTETGYTCNGAPSTCAPICGDGLVLGSESCDDGNTSAGDGCAAGCTVETGFICGGAPSTCTAVCGDGLILGAETCDDTNTSAGDGCSSACTTETGYTCNGAPSTCAPICGDGLVLGGESCDDGNVLTNDGCTGTCTVEIGWNCAGSPSACTPICGDSLVRGSESCDEGAANGSAAGCCAASCQPKASGASCDDGNACTTADSCNGANSCVGGAPPNCDDGEFCTVDSCVPATGCAHDLTARNGFACNDGNTCTSGDVCSNGSCDGAMGADSDGDGYCDDAENTSGCNANDANEIPPQSAAFGGSPVNGAGNILVTFLTPTTRNVATASSPTPDPSCATAGVCGGNGFCTAGKIADPCTSNAACNQPAGTCRIVANYAEVSALTLRRPIKLNKTVLTSFEPLTPGCSRKVDITLDPTKRSNVLKINVSGPVGGATRRDSDYFRYR